MYTSIQIPKPNDEQVLERAPIELFRQFLNDPNVTTYGRRGQAQQGVDIYGKRDGDPSCYVGIQCKLKGDEKQLTESIIKEEVDKALTFEPILKEYIIITTAPDDAKLQKYARILELEIKEKTSRVLSIQIWGWGTLEREIQKYPTALDAFYPDYTSHSKKILDGIEHIVVQQDISLDRLEKIRSDLLSSDTLSRKASDETTNIDPLERHIDLEIDGYRERNIEGQHQIAMDLFVNLQNRLPKNISGRLLFRIKANLASCLLGLGKDKEGIQLLFEAYNHAPEEPKAISNLIFAHVLNGEWEKAIKLGRRGLLKDPSNEDLAGYLVQAYISDSTISDPLQDIPLNLHETKSVRIAKLFFLRQRAENTDWRDEATALRKVYKDEPFVIRMSAEAILDSVLSEENIDKTQKFSKQIISELEVAHEDLYGIWMDISSKGSVIQTEHLAIFTNLILSCDILNKFDVAKDLIAKADEEVLTDNEISVRITQMAFNANESALFSKFLNKISQPEPRFLFEFYQALQDGNWEVIVSLTNDFERLAPQHELEFINVVREISKLLSFDGEITAKQFINILPLTKTNIKGMLFLYDALLENNFHEEAARIYLDTLQLIASTEIFGLCVMFAQRASKRSDWESVIQVLSDKVDLTSDSIELRLLTSAFVNEIPPKKSAVNFFKTLPENISGDLFYLEMEAIFHFNRGALGQSENCYRTAILKSDFPQLQFYLPLIAVLKRRQKIDEINQLMIEMLVLDLQGESLDYAKYAHFLMENGEIKKAMEIAYRALVMFPDIEDTHGVFCMLILMSTRSADELDPIPEVGVADNNCQIIIKSKSGESVEFLISDNPEKEPKGLLGTILDSRVNSLAKLCIGKAVGDCFEQNDGLGEGVSTWTLENITHKYAHVCQSIMRDFNIRFPDSSIFGRVTMEEGNVQPILDMIKKRGEDFRKIADFYINQNFPLSVMASLHNTSSIKYASSLNSLGIPIVACLGSFPEREAALLLINGRRLNGVVLDAYSAWTIASINAFSVIKKVFGKIYIAQSSLDEITYIVEDAQSKYGSGNTMSWREGQFYLDEFSEHQKEQNRGFLQEILDEVTTFCIPMSSEAPDDIPKTSKELIRSFSPTLMDSVYCSLNERVFLSEDMYLRQLAESEFGVKGVWIQAVLLYALEESLVEYDEYCRILILLAKKGHEFLTLNAAVLYEIAINDTTEKFEEFSVVANLLGSKTADISSHVSVSEECLQLIWQDRKIPSLKRKLLVSILLNNIIRFRTDDWQKILASIYISSKMNLRQYIVLWVRGHFLSLDSFYIAVNGDGERGW